MEPNVWIKRCSSNGCVEVKWACANNACVEVSRAGDRVLVRDSKLGEESPVIEFTPSGWRRFLVVAREWDRVTSVTVSGVQLVDAGGDVPVCVTDGERHLHFTREEWDAFVQGVKDGRFEVET